MTRLEDALRALFASAVESPPASDDLASLAIRRGRTIRRRRVIGGCVASALLLVVGVGTGLSLRGWWLPEDGTQTALAGPASAPRISATPTEEAPLPLSNADSQPPAAAMESSAKPLVDGGLDVRAGDALWTNGGDKLALSGVGEVTQVYRVPAGWVYGGADQVRLLRPDGTSVRLAALPAVSDASAAAGFSRQQSSTSSWVLSSDGTQLAYAAGTRVVVGALGSKGLTSEQVADVPTGTSPAAIAGGAVVLANSTKSLYDVWTIKQKFRQTWTAKVAYVYGAYEDRMFGLVYGATGTNCVALLEVSPDGLLPGATGGCELGLAYETAATGVLSPTGRWLAEQAAGSVRLIDLVSAVRGDPATVDCPVVSRTPLVWADAQTVLAADDKGTVSCSVSGKQAAAAAPSGVPSGWQFVAARTAATGSSASPSPS